MVLGATGSVGRVALEASRICGAGRIVAVARSADRLATLGELPTPWSPSTATISPAASARRGRPPTLVIDALWGAPAVAAMLAAVPGLASSTSGPRPDPTRRFGRRRCAASSSTSSATPTSVWPARCSSTATPVVDLVNDGHIPIDVDRFPLVSARPGRHGERPGQSRRVSATRRWQRRWSVILEDAYRPDAPRVAAAARTTLAR